MRQADAGGASRVAAGDSAPRLPASSSMPGELPLLRIDGSAVAVLWSHDDGLQERWVEVDRVYPDHEGRYAVGAFHWRWSATDD